MIILIGGVGYTGKTFMAQRLLEKYKYPYLSIDHLKMGLYRADIGCGFTPTDSVELIGGKIWPILKEIIMTCIENKQNLIVEGGYLLPEKIKDIELQYLDGVVSFYMGFSKEYIERNFVATIQKYRCVIEQRGYECEDTVDSYDSENAQLKEQCKKSNAKYFEIQNDYEQETGLVYDWIESKIAERQANKCI